MALFPCPDCGRDVSPAALSCPQCGCKFPRCPCCTRAIPPGTDRCPWCGNSQSRQPEPKQKKPIDAKTKYGCGTVILLLFLVGMCTSKSDNKPATTVASTPAKPTSIVSNSAWDGSVYQVERWLKDNLKDPDSFKAIEWSSVGKTTNGYMVRCKYRAKNSFGGYVIEEKVFHLDSEGSVINIVDMHSK